MLLCLTIIASVCTGYYNPLKRCSDVGCNGQSFSSGISVWGSFNYVSSSGVPLQVFVGSTSGIPVAFQWHSNIHWTSQYTLAQGEGVLGHHWWFQIKACGLSASSHYLKQCWHFANWTPRNKLRWNDDRNSYFSIQQIRRKMSFAK